jgi:hypothetical protein
MRGKEVTSKIRKWREKAKSYREECERLKKRNKELENSRDSWKAKAKGRNKELWLLRKRLSRLTSKVYIEDQAKAKGHSYSLWVMELALLMRQRGGISYRGCCKMLVIMNLMLNIDLRLPNYSTIRQWEQKLGYYRLSCMAEDEQQEWVIIVDESVSIGQEKLLLLLGVNARDYFFDQALCFEHTTVLGMAISKSWKAPQIAAQIEKVRSKGYKIAYAVADQGNNIVKALKDQTIVHVLDCTHVFSLWLEKQYKNEELFQQFCQACTAMRRKGILSKYAALLPPAQRAKARFLNLRPLFNWASKCLDLLQNEKKQAAIKHLIEHLKWIEKYQSIIVELKAVLDDLHLMQSIIKVRGINCGTLVECLHIIDQSSMGSNLKQGLKQYLQSTRSGQIHRTNIICCSDIIESYFGRYKLKAGQRISQQCLQIPNYARQHNQTEIKMAMEQVRVIDLLTWTEQNLKHSTTRQKNKLFKNTA